MNKIIGFLIPALLIGFFAASQQNYGIKAGLNYSDQKVKLEPFQSTSNDEIFGYQIGLFYRFQLNEKWAFATEANFSTAGAKYKYLEPPTDLNNPSLVVRSISNRVSYMEIPFTLQYNISGFYIGAGPSLSFLLSNPKEEYYSTPNHKAIDLAAIVVAGHKLSERLDINIRYSYGLTNALKDDLFLGNGYDKVSIKNRIGTLSFLYKLK